MSIRFTTTWARKSVRTQQQYDQWLAGLQDGDRVLYQKFIERGTSSIDSQVECWRFWPATFCRREDGRMLMRYADNSLREIADGLGSHIPGRGFPPRIVPYHGDLVVEGWRFVDGHAPVFEPKWETDRCFVLVTCGAEIRVAERFVREKFPCSYFRKVPDGQLATVFADSNVVKAEIASSGLSQLRFLYAEDTWH